jgi:hypothetical protein
VDINDIEIDDAQLRLTELMADMHDIWRRSVRELDNDAPIDLYAVDCDVVCMDLLPRASHHYGAMLRYDADARRRHANPELEELETNLVTFLGNLIFFQLQPAIPLLLIGDHALELQNILEKAAREAMITLTAGPDGKVAQNDSLLPQYFADTEGHIIVSSKAHLRAVEQAVGLPSGAADEVPAAFDQLLGQIYEDLLGHEAVRKLFRFDLLLAKGRLQHLDRLMLQDAKGAPAALPSPTRDGRYVGTVSKLAARLLQRMSQLDRGHRHPSRALRLRGDALVLAELAWINDELASGAYYVLTGNGRRRVGKLLLISGSQLLPRAIRDLKLNELQQSVYTPLSMLGHRLMDDFMQAAPESPPVADTAGVSGVRASSLINILDAMRQTLAEADAEGTAPSIATALNAVQERQARMVNSWRGRELFQENPHLHGVSQAIAELRSEGVSLQGLEGLLQKISVQAWQAFARSVTLLGFHHVASGDVNRNIPPLSLHDYPKAQHFADRLYRHADHAAPSAINAATIDPVIAEDRGRFTEFLCYALWALSVGLFRSAQGCVEVALSISEQRAGHEGEIRARAEAMYLHAHVQKLRAETIDELERALLSLPPQQDSGDAGDSLRFRAEQYSIRCHKLYLQVLGGPARQQPTRDERALEERLLAGLQLFGEIDARLPERGRYLNEYVRQQVLVNVAQLALLLRFGVSIRGDGSTGVYVPMDSNERVQRLQMQCQWVTEQLQRQYEYLAGHQDGSVPRPSLLAKAVLAVSAAWWLGRRGTTVSIVPAQYGTTLIDGRRFDFLDSAMQYCLEQKLPRYEEATPAAPATVTD